MPRVKLMVIVESLVVILAAIAAYGEDYESIESLESYKQKARVVSFECESEDGEETFVRIEVCSPKIIRVRMSPSGDFKLPALVKYGIVKTDWPKVSFSVEDEGDSIKIKTEEVWKLKKKTEELEKRLMCSRIKTSVLTSWKEDAYSQEFSNAQWFIYIISICGRRMK